MVTGCAPFFLLGLLGVAMGSWFFGSHVMARMTGLVTLTIFLGYFALLNWTAQSNIKIRQSRAGDEPPAPADADESSTNAENPIPFTDEDRREWVHYLRTEGLILRAGVVFLLLVIIILIFRK